MKRLLIAAAIAAVPLGATAQTVPAPPTPPVAVQKPFMVKGPRERNDPYYWLRDDTRKNAEMLAYLNAENAYADAVLAPTKPLQEKLFGEFVGRIKQDDATVPARQRGYYYYTRFETGGDYPIIARKRGTTQAPEQILLNVPAMAKGHNFFSIGEWMVSQDNGLLAYAQDTIGRRQYTLKVKNIATGQVMADTVENVEPNFVWADDNRTIYYIEKDPVTLAQQAGEAACARHAGVGRQAGLRGEGRQLLHGRRPHQRRQIYLHLPAEHGQQRAALHQRRAARQLAGDRAARARLPLQRRPHRQPLDHAHQLERAQLQADDAGRRAGRGRARRLGRPRRRTTRTSSSRSSSRSTASSPSSSARAATRRSACSPTRARAAKSRRTSRPMRWRSATTSRPTRPSCATSTIR